MPPRTWTCPGPATLSAGKAAWLPDSREVVFANRGALWKLDAVRSVHPSRLPFVGQNGQSPIVTRTVSGRQRLVYVRSYSDTNIWRVDRPSINGPPTPVRAVTSTRAEFLPNLSPDGGRLAFLSDRSGDPHIWVADADGSNAFQVSRQDFRSGPGFPRWSPDGQTLAFHGDPNGRPELLVSPVRGGDAKSISETLANAAFPSFSRDGKWIYFNVIDAGESHIWKMPSSGGAAVQVTGDRGTLAIEGRGISITSRRLRRRVRYGASRSPAVPRANCSKASPSATSMSPTMVSTTLIGRAMRTSCGSSRSPPRSRRRLQRILATCPWSDRVPGRRYRVLRADRFVGGRAHARGRLPIVPASREHARRRGLVGWWLLKKD